MLERVQQAPSVNFALSFWRLFDVEGVNQEYTTAMSMSNSLIPPTGGFSAWQNGTVQQNVQIAYVVVHARLHLKIDKLLT
jgi:hypothetical protein